MNGRVEKEMKAKVRMENKLAKMPEIFINFYNWMDAREKSYTTMDNYIRYVEEFMKFFTKGKRSEKFYEKVTDNDIEKYMISIRRKTVNGESIEIGDDIRATKWSALNTFFNFLNQKKYINHNPMLLTERPKIRTVHTVTYLTPDEIQSIFERIKTESRVRDKNRDACIIALGVATGLRVSAIVNINIEDIDFATYKIKIIEKGRKIREIEFGENLRNLLLIWLKDREIYFNGTDKGPLFLSQRKTRLSDDSVLTIVKKYTSHLPKHITPHKLRSSAAMNLHGQGTDILTIASILGHENITTTQRYTRAYEEDKKKATGVLDGLI